jgi:MFS family permease
MSWFEAPFVAELIGVTDTRNVAVGRYSSWIQAAFLVGWALGGGFFGRIGDLIGRSRALCLTILTYASFTGLAFFAQTWWQLLIVRLLAALGIGGEWAIGASLLSETWPRRWRPWIAAVLQTGVNIGILLASLATFLLAGHHRVKPEGVVPIFMRLSNSQTRSEIRGIVRLLHAGHRYDSFRSFAGNRKALVPIFMRLSNSQSRSQAKSRISDHVP